MEYKDLCHSAKNEYSKYHYSSYLLQIDCRKAHLTEFINLPKNSYLHLKINKTWHCYLRL